MGSPINSVLSFPFFKDALLHRAPTNRIFSNPIPLIFKGPFSKNKTWSLISTFTVSSGKESVSTWMMFSVNVPVLSVKITLVLPKVSTADNFLTMAFRLAINSIPYDKATVATMGSPSGNAATARAMDVSKIKTQSLPCINPVMAKMVVMPSVIHISFLLSTRIFSSSGVSFSFAFSTNEEIFPNWVCLAMPVTTALPLPFVTELPLNTMFNWSPRVVFLERVFVFLSMGSDSPVSEDSSHCN